MSVRPAVKTDPAGMGRYEGSSQDDPIRHSPARVLSHLLTASTGGGTIRWLHVSCSLRTPGCATTLDAMCRPLPGGTGITWARSPAGAPQALCASFCYSCRRVSSTTTESST